MSSGGRSPHRTKKGPMFFSRGFLSLPYAQKHFKTRCERNYTSVCKNFRVEKSEEKTKRGKSFSTRGGKDLVPVFRCKRAIGTVGACLERATRHHTAKPTNLPLSGVAISAEGQKDKTLEELGAQNVRTGEEASTTAKRAGFAGGSSTVALKKIFP